MMLQKIKIILSADIFKNIFSKILLENPDIIRTKEMQFYSENPLQSKVKYLLLALA